ncbi:MAG: spondin domain-containing protein [Pseudomonadota bacterium]
MTPRPRALLAAVALTAVCAAPAEAFSTFYRLDVEVSWRASDHDGLVRPVAAFPSDAHFSWLGGAVHAPGVDFWEVGLPTTPAMTRMAEFGVTSELADGVLHAGPGDPSPLVWDVADAGAAARPLNWPRWFCTVDTVDPRCGDLSVVFEISQDVPRVTLVSMIGPSPDWFIGTDGLDLSDGAGGWQDRVEVDLELFDGGMRAGNGLFMQGTGPKDGVVTRIVAPDDPRLSDPLAHVSTGQSIGWRSPGRFVFTRLTPEAQVPLPAAGLLRAGAAASLAALRRRR